MPTDEQDGLAGDLEAAIAAQAELGREYEPALVESFVERLETTIAARVAAEVERKAPQGQDWNAPFVLGVVSLGTGIPISAISASIADLPGLMVAWAGIVGVNVAHALSRRSRR